MSSDAYVPNTKLCSSSNQAQATMASSSQAKAVKISSSEQAQASTKPNSSKIANYWKAKSKHAKKLLPEDFIPSDYSVICGRTKFCFDSVGNRRFRVTVRMYIDEYKNASGKAEKSKIVTRIYNLVRESAPEGAFVTFCNGRWYECSERISREKIGAL